MAAFYECDNCKKAARPRYENTIYGSLPYDWVDTTVVKRVCNPRSMSPINQMEVHDRIIVCSEECLIAFLQARKDKGNDPEKAKWIRENRCGRV